MIKLGLYSSIASPPRGENLDRCVRETLDEAELAEASGFHGFFFGEHHQDKDGFLPSPSVVCGAAAARTRRMQIGTAVVLLPLHHPIRIAEDFATLDVVSGGRAVLGVGLGYQDADFRAFGVDRSRRAARFEQEIEIIRRAWTGEAFSYKGADFDIDNIRITPKPLQQPAPPIWIGASVGPAVERAGRIGDALVLSPSMTLSENQVLADRYRSAAETAGRTPELILMRDAWVADDLQEAADVYGPEVMDAYRYYWKAGSVSFKRFRSESEFEFEKIWCDRIITGSPSQCVDEFHRWSEALGTRYFILRLRHAHSGGPPHARIMKAIERFGRDVIPHLAR